MLAPMSGVTDIAMRRISRRFGASLVVTEMVAADAYARGDAANRLKAEGAGVSPHMVQIAGCETRCDGGGRAHRRGLRARRSSTSTWAVRPKE